MSQMSRQRVLKIAGFALALLAAALLAAGWPTEPAAAGGRATVREFQKGVAFGGLRRDSRFGTAERRSLRDLRATGAAWVELVVTASTPSVHSTAIDRLGPSMPTDDVLRKTIAYARGLGLKVLLKPHVDAVGSPWRGYIGQGFTESQWDTWFANYRAFIVHYAELARESGVDEYSIGCELDATVRREADWRWVVAVVRSAYHGPLMYSDDQVLGHPDAIRWWDAVDMIGEDIYPTLSQKSAPSVADLRNGWRKYMPWLHQLALRWHKPVLLTEIGCRSVTGGAQYPGDSRRIGLVDLGLQRRWYAAALKELGRRPWLVGTFWWVWSPDPRQGGPSDTGFTPRGKPAEQVLRAWYGRSL
jgi:hypothetical protein